ncbi:MAG: exonuclease domain-containing protein [Anaerolineae bacterium]|nr:exonuclease domain-containing protein [Anaerolineae bacterium]MCO5206742.1 exonuclease domain-containing protein [Anaerolineae bacterium]
MQQSWLDQPIEQVPLVVLDTETTGLYPGLGNRIVEVGALRLEAWQEVGTFDRLIYPDRAMDAGASAVNHIYDSDLEGQPRFVDIADELLALLDGAVIVAHNAVFDAGFLGLEYWLAGYAPAEREPVLPNPWICTLLLARNHFYFGRNSLGHIAAQLGVRRGTAHRALNDVYMTAEVLKRMTRQLGKKGMKTVGDILHAQGEAIYTPPVVPIPLPAPLDEAIAENRQAIILYMSRDGVTERVISPRYAAHHRGHDYLIAHCHLRDDQRSFRLDRILSAKLVA